MLSETFLQDEEVWSWAGRRRNGEAGTGPGEAFYGDPGDPDTFRAVHATTANHKKSVALVCLREPTRTAGVVQALTRSHSETKVLVTTANGELDGLVGENVRK